MKFFVLLLALLTGPALAEAYCELDPYNRVPVYRSFNGEGKIDLLKYFPDLRDPACRGLQIKSFTFIGSGYDSATVELFVNEKEVQGPSGSRAVLSGGRSVWPFSVFLDPEINEAGTHINELELRIKGRVTINEIWPNLNY